MLEQDLAEAIHTFLSTWAVNNEDARHPNLVHLGADARVRKAKAEALPREVPLKAWIEQRLSDSVLVAPDELGRTIVRLTADDGDVASDAPIGEAQREGPSPHIRSRSRSRSRGADT